MTVTLDATTIAVLVAWSAIMFWLGRRSGGSSRDLSGPPAHMGRPGVKPVAASPPSMQSNPASQGPQLQPGMLEAVQAALMTGNKIMAIKLYREATGVGLAEAKAAVEAMER